MSHDAFGHAADDARGGRDATAFDVEWDAGDLGCGELLLKLRMRLRGMPGQVIRLTARDPGALADIPSYCRVTGHQLVHHDPTNRMFWIRAKR